MTVKEGDLISFTTCSNADRQFLQGVVAYKEQLGFITVVDGVQYELRKLLSVSILKPGNISPVKSENKQRAERAFRTVLHYQQILEKNEISASVQDLLTDLMHLSDEYNFDLEEVMIDARSNYDAEKEEATE